MLDLSNKIQEFLDEVNHTGRRNTSIDGFPATEYTSIALRPELGMFEVLSGYEIRGNNDGRNEDARYYFKADEFLPVIEQLREIRTAQIDLPGYYIKLENRWDHSYASPDDEGAALIQQAHIRGTICLEENSIKCNLNATLKPLSKELSSDFEVIDEIKVTEALQNLSGRNARNPNSE